MDFFIFSISGVTFVTIVLLHILYGRSKSHRLPKGTLITLESGKLVFENLVLWIYAIPWFFLIRVPVSPISVVVMMFVNCCLARHVMLILKEQSCRWYEPTIWMLRLSCRQFFVSVVVIGVFFLVGMDLLIRLANTHVSLYLALPILIVFICAMALVSLVGPIIATERFYGKDIIVEPIKRSVRIVWQHLGVYATMLVLLFAYASFLVLVDRAADILFVQVFAWRNSKPLSTFVLMVCIMQIVIAHTIFYYEFYVKKETALPRQ